MYDSVTPTNILKQNATPDIVAGYMNGPYAWSSDEWNLFPHSLKLTISVRASYLNAHALDCETGDATPSECPDWALTRRAMGGVPIIYGNRTSLTMVSAAFQSRQIPEPLYWVATASGQAVIPTGAIGAQYLLDFQGVDVSAMADFIPGLDSAPILPIATNDEESDMLPKVYPATPNGGTLWDTLIWDGSPGVLNIIALDSGDDCYVSQQCYNWGPHGGAGGGTPVPGNNLPSVPGGWRITHNLPGQFTVPGGTTSVSFSYSCAGRTCVQLVKS